LKQQGVAMAFEDRKYVIIPTSEISNVNFDEVLETAPETCRYSADGSKTFVKYEGDMPNCVASIQNKSIEYTHEEILNILATAEWSSSQLK
jgi:hypothetical protein